MRTIRHFVLAGLVGLSSTLLIEGSTGAAPAAQPAKSSPAQSAASTPAKASDKAPIKAPVSKPAPAKAPVSKPAPGPVGTSPGKPISYSSFQDRGVGGAARVHLVEVNLKDQRVGVDIAMAKGQASARENVTEIAKRSNAVVAINGSFFQGTNVVDSSVGLIMRNGEIIADSGHRRTSLGITRQGTFVMGIPQISTGLYYPESNRFQRVNGVNQVRKAKQTIVYTPRFGASTHTNNFGREVLVQDNRVVGYTYGNSKIPRNGFVISAHGKNASQIQALYPQGSYIEISAQRQAAWDKVDTVITGSPHLVHQGRIYNTFYQEKLNSSLKAPAARSAVGFTHNQKLLMVNVLPENGKGGVTLTRLAQIMRRLGAYEAMALDGGGSTSLYVSQHGINANRGVTNALIVTLDAKKQP